MYVSGDMVVRWMCVGRWAGGQGVVTCECGRRAGGGWLSKFMVRGGRGRREKEWWMGWKLRCCTGLRLGSWSCCRNSW